MEGHIQNKSSNNLDNSGVLTKISVRRDNEMLQKSSVPFQSNYNSFTKNQGKQRDKALSDAGSVHSDHSIHSISELTFTQKARTEADSESVTDKKSIGSSQSKLVSALTRQMSVYDRLAARGRLHSEQRKNWQPQERAVSCIDLTN